MEEYLQQGPDEHQHPSVRDFPGSNCRWRSTPDQFGSRPLPDNSVQEDREPAA
jgi:hypothetical protein